MRPGRILRSAPAFAFLVACLSGLACSSWLGEAKPRVPATLELLWRDYQALPDQRALAVAGDLDTERWVAGLASGHRDRASAREAALAECLAQRRRQRMQSPCKIFSVGSKILWRGW